MDEDLLERASWIWSPSLIALTVAIHVLGVAMMALVMEKIRFQLDNRSLGLRYVIPIVIGLVGAVGLLLAVLHGIEATIWAAAYLWLGALGSPRDAMLYSVDSMSTRGASGLRLQRHWQMMGALEAGDGMLLFGISTAYIFAMMQIYWPMLTRQRATRRLKNSSERFNSDGFAIRALHYRVHAADFACGNFRKVGGHVPHSEGAGRWTYGCGSSNSSLADVKRESAPKDAAPGAHVDAT